MRASLLLACSLLCLLSNAAWAEGKTRLFILSGQSNMAGLKPEVSFTPAVKEAYADDEVIVVKHAQGGQPIRRWYKDWKAPAGSAVKAEKPGDLYEVLMEHVEKAIAGKKIDSVVFVWMQGERDARERLESVYAASLQGLVDQLSEDLKRTDIKVVIGRLSDCNNGQPGWDGVRAAQVKFSESDPQFGWVDTDDLNDPGNGLHYNQPGYAELGKRFAKRAQELLAKEK